MIVMAERSLIEAELAGVSQKSGRSLKSGESRKPSRFQNILEWYFAPSQDT